MLSSLYGTPDQELKSDSRAKLNLPPTGGAQEAGYCVVPWLLRLSFLSYWLGDR
jgi:hypothetical protein